MRISETQYNAMPEHLKSLFNKLPNYGKQEVMDLFPDSSTTGNRRDFNKSSKSPIWSSHPEQWKRNNEYIDSGSAARFFYCAKASRSERDKGLEDMEVEPIALNTGEAHNVATLGRETTYHNNHPTVKPLSLISYLVKLVKMPHYNLILDPFCGSGTTLLACIKLGIPCIGIDSDEKSCEIAAKRCSQSVMRLEI